MIKNLWCMGQAALAISLFLSIGGPNLRADDVQLIDCRTDGTGAGAYGHAGNRAGFIDPTLGMGDCDACQGGAVRRGHGRHGAGCGCDVCRGYGRGGHGRHGYANGGSGYGHGGYGRHGRGGYVDNLYAQGHGGRGGYGADGCPTCRHGHRHGHGDCDACRGGSAGNGLAGNGCDNGRCNGGCRGGGCLGGGCYKPVNGWYRDPRDSEVYSAVGYNVPVAVPLPPVVKYQYQYGWGIPASRLTRVTNTYQRYYPYEQFTQKGGRIPGGPPVIYHPTDTTQQGFYSVHAPRWVPVKRINSIGYYYGR